jgi:hypothetical protein
MLFYVIVLFYMLNFNKKKFKNPNWIQFVGFFLKFLNLQTLFASFAALRISFFTSFMKQNTSICSLFCILASLIPLRGCKPSEETDVKMRRYKRSKKPKTSVVECLNLQSDEILISQKKSRGACGKDQKPRKRGTAHGNYKHGQGANRVYDPEKYPAFIQAVQKKYEYKCFITKKSKNDCELAVHHLEGWDRCPEHRYDSSNGVLISKEIHDHFHNEYGRGQNTTEQFEKYLTEKHSITHFPWRDGNHDPSLTTEEYIEKVKTFTERKKQELFDLMSLRDHFLVEGTKFTAHSEIKVFCLKHEKTYTTTVRNYKRCKSGLLCCGRDLQSDATKRNHKFGIYDDQIGVPPKLRKKSS